uniref:Uncharacterized protein n=1 Tax=Anopheles quadriannulatus TaxID=34691 RepID=A0A182XP99_ANOQN
MIEITISLSCGLSPPDPYENAGQVGVVAPYATSYNAHTVNHAVAAPVVAAAPAVVAAPAARFVAPAAPALAYTAAGLPAYSAYTAAGLPGFGAYSAYTGLPAPYVF